jgi:hypothetical protein
MNFVYNFIKSNSVFETTANDEAFGKLAKIGLVQSNANY